MQGCSTEPARLLVRLAKRHGVVLRQSYARVGKSALIKHQRYAHAKQFKRANRALKTLRTYLGRVIRGVTVRSMTTPGSSRWPSRTFWHGHVACVISGSISADLRFIPCTPRGWSASARARPIAL